MPFFVFGFGKSVPWPRIEPRPPKWKLWALTAGLPGNSPLKCLLQLGFMLFSYSVMSDSLQPHGLQQSRLPCPSQSLGVFSNSCPLNRWCHPTLSSSVARFSSCPQPFPEPGSKLVNQGLIKFWALHLSGALFRFLSSQQSPHFFPWNWLWKSRLINFRMASIMSLSDYIPVQSFNLFLYSLYSLALKVRARHLVRFMLNIFSKNASRWCVL